MNHVLLCNSETRGDRQNSPGHLAKTMAGSCSLAEWRAPKAGLLIDFTCRNAMAGIGEAYGTTVMIYKLLLLLALGMHSG